QRHQHERADPGLDLAAPSLPLGTAHELALVPVAGELALAGPGRCHDRPPRVGLGCARASLRVPPENRVEQVGCPAEDGRGSEGVVWCWWSGSPRRRSTRTVTS